MSAERDASALLATRHYCAAVAARCDTIAERSRIDDRMQQIATLNLKSCGISIADGDEAATDKQCLAADCHRIMTLSSTLSRLEREAVASAVSRVVCSAVVKSTTRYTRVLAATLAATRLPVPS